MIWLQASTTNLIIWSCDTFIVSIIKYENTGISVDESKLILFVLYCYWKPRLYLTVSPHDTNQSRDFFCYGRVQSKPAYPHWVRLLVGMPLLTRCHWQCLDRLSQIFATLCKVSFYVWFSIENEGNAGNFCPGLNHWALLSVQFGCFSKTVDYLGN